MRVISVLPSATEIVCALGHEGDLIARSSECDFPESVRRLPAVMRPRVWDSDRPSREIDGRVRESRSRGESLYELDVGLLRDLRPDLLLTQDLCGVCSVTEAEVVAACATARVHPHVVSLVPTRLDEVWTSVETVGRALGDEAAGTRLATDLRRQTSPPARPGRSVAIVEWLDPPILAGLWTPDIVRAAGGRPIGPAPAEPGRRTTWSKIMDSAPDLVILSPCSFSVQRTLQELTDARLAREVSRLNPPLGVYVADEAYFSRPGPRLASGVRLVRDLLGERPPAGPMPVEAWADTVEHASA